jgi:tetratricopeptide (TPR) repeat protein
MSVHRLDPMFKRLAEILFGCGAALALSGCPHVTPEKSAREWMADGLAHSSQGRWDDAIEDFAEVLRREPKSREALVLRAKASLNNNDADQALEDSQAALELKRDDPELLRFQASIRRRHGELEAANKLDREANRLFAASPEGLLQRGQREMNAGDYASASRHYERALQLEPHNAECLNAVAWLQAVCPDGALRNGSHAIELALEACQLTQWRESRFVDTLAAAYAETGQFEKAVKMQQKAVDLAPPALRERDGYLPRLAMYQESKQFRLDSGQ